MIAMTIAGYPMLLCGTRPNSDTARAFVKASSAAAARTCWMTPRRACGATDIATNSNPVSAAAHPAMAANSSR